jgi:hypothetical protein
MKKITSFIRDSYALSQLLETTSFPQDCVILIADVVNLYPSISIPDGLLQLGRALRICNFPEIEIEYILDLTRWVLSNNYFHFGDSTWHQKKGTAMGTPLAVVFANIYLAMLESECLEKCKLNPEFKLSLLYKRFVDDKIGIFRDRVSAEIFINTFNSLRPSFIQSTFAISDISGIFMDLEFFKGPRFLATGYFDSKVYQKELNNYLYIPPFSSHTKVNIKSMLLSELQRYCIYSTENTDFLDLKTLFYDRLLARGYTPLILQSTFLIILDRTTLRNKRNDSLKVNKMTPPIFQTTNTPRTTEMNIGPLLKYTEDVNKDKDAAFFIPLRQPIVSRKRTKNLANLLVTSKFNSLVTPFIVHTSSPQRN